MAIQIDVVVGVIDRVDERVSFVHFVGMLVGSCFNMGVGDGDVMTNLLCVNVGEDTADHVICMGILTKV